MTFLNPILLSTGLACVAIPILIHILMRRRRRPMAWGAMKFLLEAYKRQRRRTNLEQILLLAARCLLVALLALALGKPVLGAAGLIGSTGARTIFLVVDNSLTSGASEPGAETALERSRAGARALLEGLDPTRGDRAALIALAGPAEAVISPPSADLASVRSALNDLAPADSRADYARASAVLADQVQRVTREDASARATLAIFSEFRAGAADTASTLAGLGVPAERLTVLATEPADRSFDNLSVAGVEPLRLIMLPAPGTESSTTASFRVLLRRAGPGVGSSATSKVVLRVGVPGAGEPARGDGVVTWGPGATSASTVIGVELSAKAAISGRLVVTATIDRDAIAGDNTFRRPVEARERVDVGLVSPGPVGGRASIDQYTPADWLALALSPEADLNVRRRQGGELRLSIFDPARAGAAAASGASLADMDVVLVPRPDLLDRPTWNTLRRVADRGGTLMVFPPPAAQAHLWTDDFIDALGLDWTIDRETREVNARLSGERPSASGDDLLEGLSGELPELAPAVGVTRMLGVSSGPGAMEPLLTLDSGAALVVSSVGSPRGTVVFIGAAMDLSWTDLPAKPLMVPLIQELVRQSIGRSGSVGVATAGLTPTLPPGSTDLVRQSNETETAGPAASRVNASGDLTPPIRSGGVFLARGPNAASLGLVCVNADLSASDPDPRPREELARWLSGLGSDVTWIAPGAGSADVAPDSGAGNRPPISMPLLAAALALAVLEAFMARVFSHAKAERGCIPVSEARGASKAA